MVSVRRRCKIATSRMVTLSPQPDPETNAWRIYHDELMGVWVDHFDGHWLVQTRGTVLPDHVKDLANGVARSVYWKPRDKSASTAPEWVWGERVEEKFTITENGAKFLVDFSAGYSPGIFLDQRLNRQRVKLAVSAGDKVLNTFAYTGAFSVMAALAGAETTTLDLSSSYLDWTWENFTANNLDPKQHHGCKGDAFEWLTTFARQGRKFDGIILDPPTFSRSGKKGKKSFSTDNDYKELVQLAAKVVEPGGWMLCCANTHRMKSWRFEDEVIEGLGGGGYFESAINYHEMPPEFHRDDYLKSLWVDVGSGDSEQFTSKPSGL